MKRGAVKFMILVLVVVLAVAGARYLGLGAFVGGGRLEAVPLES